MMITFVITLPADFYSIWFHYFVKVLIFLSIRSLNNFTGNPSIPTFLKCKSQPLYRSQFVAIRRFEDTQLVSATKHEFTIKVAPDALGGIFTVNGNFVLYKRYINIHATSDISFIRMFLCELPAGSSLLIERGRQKKRLGVQNF